MFVLLACFATALGGCGPSDQGHYYRMKVGLTYKGKPVDIDFVAGCNVHNGRDISGGSIHEISGMTDLFRGVRMPEGHAVVINTYPWFESPRFNPCDGDTTDRSGVPQADPRVPDNRVPKDWLPFIEWFERDDEFAHGIGYLTQDAYENKNARFGFRYARIEHATRKEFDTFRKTGPANLLPPHQTDWTIGGPEDPFYRNVTQVPQSVRANPPSGWWHASERSCGGVLRWRPTEAQRAKLRAVWPKDRPTYWTLDTDKQDHRKRWDLAAAVTAPHDSYANGAGAISLTHFNPSYSAEERARQPQIFPIAYNQSLARLRPTTSPIPEETVLIGDGETNRGFVFCDAGPDAVFTAVTGKEPVAAACSVKIDDLPLPWFSRDACNPITLWPVFQRDDYVISHLQYNRG